MKRIKYLVPRPVRTWLNRRRHDAQRQLIVFDRVTDWSQLRKVHPHRPDFGARRGECIDRYYIEKFFASYGSLIRGHVAEIGSDHYIRQFGRGNVAEIDVLDIDEKNDRRTLAIDLMLTASAPADKFDCIVCPQTLFELYDFNSAIRSLFKMLRPNGLLLATVPGISQSVRGGMLGGAGSDWWRFTALSAHRVFGEIFGESNVQVHTYGNVLSAIAFLHGLVQEELTRDELEFHDPDYEVTIGIAATKRIAN